MKEYYKNQLTFYIPAAVCITIIYGGMSTWTICNRGFHGETHEWLIYGWGYFATIISWIVVWGLYKQYKKN